MVSVLFERRTFIYSRFVISLLRDVNAEIFIFNNTQVGATYLPDNTRLEEIRDSVRTHLQSKDTGRGIICSSWAKPNETCDKETMTWENNCGTPHSPDPLSSKAQTLLRGRTSHIMIFVSEMLDYFHGHLHI